MGWSIVFFVLAFLPFEIQSALAAEQLKPLKVVSSTTECSETLESQVPLVDTGWATLEPQQQIALSVTDEGWVRDEIYRLADEISAAILTGKKFEQNISSDTPVRSWLKHQIERSRVGGNFVNVLESESSSRKTKNGTFAIGSAVGGLALGLGLETFLKGDSLIPEFTTMGVGIAGLVLPLIFGDNPTLTRSPWWLNLFWMRLRENGLDVPKKSTRDLWLKCLMDGSERHADLSIGSNKKLIQAIQDMRISLERLSDALIVAGNPTGGAVVASMLSQLPAPRGIAKLLLGSGERKRLIDSLAKIKARLRGLESQLGLEKLMHEKLQMILEPPAVRVSLEEGKLHPLSYLLPLDTQSQTILLKVGNHILGEPLLNLGPLTQDAAHQATFSARLTPLIIANEMHVGESRMDATLRIKSGERTVEIAVQVPFNTQERTLDGMIEESAWLDPLRLEISKRLEQSIELRDVLTAH